MRTEIVSQFSKLEEIACDWDRLWRASRRDVFGTLSWARASWRAYGSTRILCTPVVSCGDEVVGILPLVAEGRTLRFLGSPRADYNDVLCLPEYAARVLDAGLRSVWTLPFAWNRCVLENVPAHSSIVAHLDKLPSDLRARIHLSFSSHCPSVRLSSNREAVLASILRKKSLRRHENRLRRLGAVRFRHADSRAEIRRHLPIFFRQHVARRAMTGDRSIFCDGRARRFFEAVVDELDPRRELRFSVLEVDGLPIAYHCGFEMNGTFVWYKPTFDIDYWDYSPGEVLIKNIFEYVRDHDLQEVDFTVGHETFKGRFANEVNCNFVLNVFPAGLHGRVGRLSHRVKGRLKELPRTFRAAKMLVNTLKWLENGFVKRIRQHGVFGLSRKAVAGAWRSAVFSRDRILVFEATGDTAGRVANDSVEVITGTLAELACLATQQPQFLTSAKLAEARNRIKRNGRPLIVTERNGCVHVAWVGVGSERTELEEAGLLCRLPIGRDERIIYDCWTPGGVRGGSISSNALGAIVTLLCRPGERCWIHCREHNRAFHKAVLDAGFRPRFEIEETRHFGLWSRGRVTALGG